MAITVHIRPIGEDSEDEETNIQLDIKQEDENNSLHAAISPLPPASKQQQSSSSSRSESVSKSSSHDTPISSQPSKSVESNVLSPTGSTTQEDTPPPSYIPVAPISATSLTQNTSSSSFVSSERPATPTTHLHTRSALGRKRSLTLLSPENVSTRSTRELKRKPSNRIRDMVATSVIDKIDNTNHDIINTEELNNKDIK